MGLELSDIFCLFRTDLAELAGPFQGLLQLLDGEESGSGFLRSFPGLRKFGLISEGPILLSIEEEYLKSLAIIGFFFDEVLAYELGLVA